MYKYIIHIEICGGDSRVQCTFLRVPKSGRSFVLWGVYWPPYSLKLAYIDTHTHLNLSFMYNINVNDFVGEGPNGQGL